VEKEDHIKYWIESSQHDLSAAERILESKNYDWALFIAHLSIEKLFKALWVRNNESNYPPRIHNLLKIAEEAGLILSKDEKLFLLEVNDFNLETRYPDYKLDFYHKCTKEFSANYLTKIKEFHNCMIKRI
jgi:HEPN domain-containing protein